MRVPVRSTINVCVALMAAQIGIALDAGCPAPFDLNFTSAPRLHGSNRPTQMASSIPEKSCNWRDQMRPFSLDQSEEFERIALVYREVLLRVASRILRCDSLAEDAVQETLLSAWRAFDKFERGSNCKAWLFRIMLNGIRRNRRRAVPLAELPFWRQDYNEQRPHSSLNYRTPAESARQASYGKDLGSAHFENADGVSNFPTASAAAG
jgi:transposase InsO family protein